MRDNKAPVTHGESGTSKLKKELREIDKDRSWKGDALKDAERAGKQSRRPGAAPEEDRGTGGQAGVGGGLRSLQAFHLLLKLDAVSRGLFLRQEAGHLGEDRPVKTLLGPVPRHLFRRPGLGEDALRRGLLAGGAGRPGAEHMEGTALQAE